MAASVNNIAATFAASRSSSSSLPPATTSASVRPISATLVSALWNPHSTLPRALCSSFLGLYGLPGPLRRGTHSPFRAFPLSGPHSPIPIGSRLPNALLSFLDDQDSIRTISLNDLTRGRKAVILSASAAFAPSPLSGGARELVRKTKQMKSRGVGIVACVTANDVYVMKAWGESLGAEREGLMMLSDPDAELASALGTGMDMRGGAEGLGLRSESFCMVAVNGDVKAVFLHGGQSSCLFDEVMRAL